MAYSLAACALTAMPRSPAGLPGVAPGLGMLVMRLLASELDRQPTRRQASNSVVSGGTRAPAAARSSQGARGPMGESRSSGEGRG